MKKKLILSLVVLASISTACNNAKNTSNESDSTINTSEEGMMKVDKPTVKSGSYVNLSTGKKVYVIPDPITGVAIDSITQIPIEFYYNPITLDTIYQNGLTVNHMLINLGNGKYKLDDMKIKIDGDEIKIKTDTSKIKIDGTDMKIKSGDQKTKITDDTIKVKN
ncbi:MAG: hypothetical protein KKE39_13140 [Bacteroidetes bacterium]|nr:hypothetical protein [Bacteroidota bacterium]MBU1372034.1 hypothetical protein [Bacteroidota bacterium]MBU1483636.1 hypothetical protein [Bacteroidota bacterium]MBU1761922.1 hypothetical protein [Bacteroidota bacterium]MBU2268039.1 hypothetical protein [Bacteroidota bacterium]